MSELKDYGEYVSKKEVLEILSSRAAPWNGYKRVKDLSSIIVSKCNEAKIFTGEQKYLMIKALKQYRDCAGDFLSYDEYIDLDVKVGEIIKLLDVEGEMK